MFGDGGSRRNKRVSWFDDQKGRGNAPKNRFKQFYESMVAREQQREKAKMANIVSTTFKLMYGQVPCEFSIRSEDDESLTTSEIMSQIDFMIEQGFTAPRAFEKSEDSVGKRGTVVSVLPVPNTKMFEVTGKLDDGKEFKWKEFTATSFRKNDRFEVIKNDRGFKQGQWIAPEQSPLLGADDIPF